MRRSRTVCHFCDKYPRNILDNSSELEIEYRWSCSDTVNLGPLLFTFQSGFHCQDFLYPITRQYGVNAECVYPRYTSVVWRISLCQSWIYLDMTYSSHPNHSDDAYSRITIKDKAKQSAIVLVDITVRY